MPTIVGLVAIICWIFEPSSHEYLPYELNPILEGEWWRVITGHFLHTNSVHLALNLLGVILLWALHGQYYGYQSLWTVIILCLGTSFGIFMFSKHLVWYVGLSGILHGLFIVGAYKDVMYRIKTGWLLLIAVWLKVIHEQIMGPSKDVSSLIEANVAIDAHLSGTVSGSVIVMGLFIFKHILKRWINSPN
ncbi:rhombosortase [Paraglaciecola sp.]|uniref:rhombosortase n=1 Tax=Paraglaciecola sp. TaxID=1920173 RepID=UPI003EF1BF03